MISLADIQPVIHLGLIPHTPLTYLAAEAIGFIHTLTIRWKQGTYLVGYSPYFSKQATDYPIYNIEMEGDWVDVYVRSSVDVGDVSDGLVEYQYIEEDNE